MSRAARSRLQLNPIYNGGSRSLSAETGPTIVAVVKGVQGRSDAERGRHGDGIQTGIETPTEDVVSLVVRGGSLIRVN